MVNRHIKTDLTGGVIPGAIRLAAWLDGRDDEIIVEWWALSGSFLRTAYNRSSTRDSYSYFEPVGTEEFDYLTRLLGEYRMAQQFPARFFPVRCNLPC
jgi:hypothetical protein